MDEDDLRRLAAAARTLLDIIVADKGDQERIGRDLDRALALPPGQDVPELIDVLSAHPQLRNWTAEHASWLREDQYLGEGVSRWLVVDSPATAPKGHVVSVHAQITREAPAGWGEGTPLAPFDIPPEGAGVTITVSARGLKPLDDLQHYVLVPREGDAPPVLFSFAADREGRHAILVRAYRNGTFLGQVATEISVESGAPVRESRHTAAMGSMAGEPGEVTLEVDATGDGSHRYRLIGEGIAPTELVASLGAVPAEVVAPLIAELDRLARNGPANGDHQAALHRLRNHGATLWGQAVPDVIREQFWVHHDRITSFTVASDADLVPWELLYPVDGSREDRFLVEQFPVLRRVPGQERARSLTLRTAAYVIPPGSPTDAAAEVAKVRNRVGGGVSDSVDIHELAKVRAMIDAAPPNLLHFSCHNEFSEDLGSAIRFDDGWLDLTDLGLAVQRRSFAPHTPLVFLNACRTAGEIPGLSKTMSWARRFMEAGAGIFVGTLWAIGSESALGFADEFYRLLLVERQTLGEAVKAARAGIAAVDGDPTWLAYTVYGNPAATVAVAGDPAPR